VGIRRAEGRARINVQHGIWKDHRRDESDWGLALELLRAGYPPKDIGDQFVRRAKRDPDYVDRTVRAAYRRELELRGPDRER
jgi:hypothetical protein